MPRLRNDYFLAGLLIAVGLALRLGAAGHSWAAATTFAALSLTDVLFAAVGLLVAVMTGVAGALVVADVRTDTAAARAWQEIRAEMAVRGTAGESASVGGSEARYTIRPQDENLRRILLAHRFVVPVSWLSDASSAALGRADAIATGDIDGVRSSTELLITDQHTDDDCHRARMPANSDAAFYCPPLPVAGKVGECDRRGQSSTKRRVPKVLLVANAGVWWQYPIHPLGDACHLPVDVGAADVIVLADRSSRNANPAHRDVSPVAPTTAQPGCRGPPFGASERQVSSGPGSIGKSSRENVQSRANASTDPAVVDNLGDRVPVGAAELEVVETFLDDVLRDLLATVAAGQDHRES